MGENDQKKGIFDIKIKGNIHAHACALTIRTQKVNSFHSVTPCLCWLGGKNTWGTDEVHFWLADDKARQGLSCWGGCSIRAGAVLWHHYQGRGLQGWGRWHRHHVKSFQSQWERGGGGKRRWKINECWHSLQIIHPSVYEGENFLACARTLFSYSTLFWLETEERQTLRNSLHLIWQHTHTQVFDAALMLHKWMFVWSVCVSHQYIV